MSFLLKIVEGPNKGAEIALVSGVAVTLGKGDDCDIVLADPTLPSTPVSLEASDDGVTLDGERLDPFVVKTSGATSFAVGPADVPWGELKWPEKVVEAEPEKAREPTDERKEKKEAPSAPNPAPEDGAPPPEEGKKKKRGGCCGCLVVLVLLLFALAGVAWFYQVPIKDFCDSKGYDVHALRDRVRISEWFGKSEKPGPVERITLSSVAARYGLSVEERDGTAKLAGNLKTRAERLRATAEAYEAQPGVELDISDDESFKAAADDALFTLTEGALKAVTATNRVLSIRGVSRSPTELGRLLRALNADLPKLRNVDVAGVRFGVVPKHEATDVAQANRQPDVSPVARFTAKKKHASPSLPVCGILTKPYPCLVMRDGTRVLEGAALGENVILKIEADAVTVTNSTGRFMWRP